MQLQKTLDKLECSDVFKKFHQEHKSYYLTHFFCMYSKGVQSAWQIGYYSRKTDKIAVFEVDGEITMHQEEEVFKEKKFVKELKVEKVMELENALEIVENYRKENYPQELENQKICILQNIEEGIVWNITLISLNFNMLNLKLRASDGQILKHSFESILRLGKDKL